MIMSSLGQFGKASPFSSIHRHPGIVGGYWEMLEGSSSNDKWIFHCNIVFNLNYKTVWNHIFSKTSWMYHYTNCRVYNLHTWRGHILCRWIEDKDKTKVICNWQSADWNTYPLLIIASALDFVSSGLGCNLQSTKTTKKDSVINHIQREASSWGT